MSSLQYNEIFDARKLQYIINNWDSISFSDSEIKNNNEKWQPLSILNNYLNNSKFYKDNQHIIKVNYKQNHKDIGRFFARGSLSLQSLPREIRHTISKDFYYDIDIVNAHPEILYQYCKRHNLETPNLKEYIDNRQDILNDIMNKGNITKDEAKKLILSITNGGQIKNNLECLFIYKYRDEINYIHDYICNLKENDEYLKIGTTNAKKKNGYNIKGSTVNVLLTNIENIILTTMINYLTAKKIIKKNIVLVFDGFMILKEDLKSSINDLIIDLEKHVKTITGYEIKLIEKEMNEDIKVPEDYIFLTSEPEIKNNELIAMTDNEAANILLKKINDDYNICICEGVKYMKVNNIWINDNDLIEQKLIKICANLNIKKYKYCSSENPTEPTINIDGNQYYLNKFEAYSANYTSAKNIVKLVYNDLKVDNKLNNRIYTTTLRKLCFNNGYYDFEKLEFINNYDDVETNIKIDMDFPERNENVMFSIYEKVLKPILGADLLQPFLHFISRVIAGECQDKLWSICLGERDCGKGVLSDLLSNTFGQYVCSINANSLKIDKNNGDEAKKLSWLYHAQYARVLLGNEIANNNVMDGNLIKKICSGGDKIQLRTNYVNEINVRIQGTLILFNNDMPKVEPADCFQKLIPFSLPSKFVDEITQDDIKKNPHYKVADSMIKSFVSQEEVCQAFVWILIDSYKDSKVKLVDCQKVFIDNFKTEDEFDIFNENFEITKNDMDRVKSSDITDFLKRKNINMSMAKISNYLTNRGCIHGTHKFGSKAFKGFKGLRQIEIFNIDE